RRAAGLFDVSHMGRFVFRGSSVLPFLQKVLTNNAAALDVGQSQYTMIPDPNGGAIDDAYLYRFYENEYLLVVNAANREKDWEHLQALGADFEDLDMKDQSSALAMMSLQGPQSKALLYALLTGGALPEPEKNALSHALVDGIEVRLARTGYTGEPLGFELFVPSPQAVSLWQALLAQGATAVGLGARDTLRLEAGLPLYGHELGQDRDGHTIPIYACGLARFAVSFTALKGDFIGRQALERQFKAWECIQNREPAPNDELPRIIMPLALTGKGIARAGAQVHRSGGPAGYVTSGTMVPYWQYEGQGIASRITAQKGRRSIALALLDSDLREGDSLEVDIRGKRYPAMVVPYHLRAEAPPLARPILYDQLYPDHRRAYDLAKGQRKVRQLVEKALANHAWRQRECINLIPSEQTASRLTRLLSILDPVGRYAEHKPVAALEGHDVFYYQGTEFIAETEALLASEIRQFLGCSQAETRVISGQMANTAVFSAMVDYLNRTDRRREPLRMGRVMNHHIIKGGHLSAQPMGALRDFVARDPRTEKPAVVNFPVFADNPYRVDVEACRELLDIHRPSLVIFGRSMTLYREPVAEIRAMVEDMGLETILMYDMAHVLGLTGPHFQEPFREGADLVTGSTHKTFFGTQRGVVAMDVAQNDATWPLWEAVQRRAFPGSVSNHHLGTLLGLLLAAYEMNAFKDGYQRQVIANAKALAAALDEVGLQVAGDRAMGFTETHQVIVHVGYAQGPEIAQRLEDNNIIVNYQAGPTEEGFTASGALRMGVAEMTRFGMQEIHMRQLAQFFHDIIADRRRVKDEIAAFRQQFQEMHFCFPEETTADLIEQLWPQL
ncbi:MAG: glycine cleavage system protein T, partial [Desulfobacterales bacterium]